MKSPPTFTQGLVYAPATVDDPQLLLSARKARDIVELAGVLLLYCRGHEAQYREASNSYANRIGEAALREAAADLFRAIGSEALEAAETGAVDRLLSEPSLPLVVRARAVAVGLDSALGSRFQGVFRSKGKVRLQAAAPIPVARPPLRELLERVNSLPERLDERVDRLPRLRLAPGDLRPFAVDLDFSSADQLAPLISEKSQTFATCHPNRTHDEYVPVVPCLTAEDRFFWFSPEDVGRQRRILRCLLEQAASGEATIVVLPELCLDAETAQEILADFRGLRSKVRLFLAGSHHVEVGGFRRNQALALLRGRKEPLHYWKSAPFVARYGMNRPLQEDIHLEAEPLITAYFSGDWSFSILICKDFLDARMRNLLTDLGVNLLLLPAMTPVTDAFEAFAQPLTQTNQAWVVMANTPAQPSNLHAVFGGPLRGRFNATVNAVGTRGRRGAPGVCFYRVRDGHVLWVDAERIFD